MKKIKLTCIMAGFVVAGHIHAQWYTTGNAITTTDYMGATLGSNVNPIIFKTGNGTTLTERFRISGGTAGRIGINTSAPNRQLHVTTNESNGGIRVTQTSVGFSGLELFNSSVGGRNWGLGSSGNSNEMPGTFALFDWTATKYRIIVDETGDVGINMHNLGVGPSISRPDQKLHVHNGAIKISGSVPGYGGPMILFGSAADATTGLGLEKWGIEYTTVGESGLNFWRPGIVNGNNYLFLNDNGNVGIGTNDPGTCRLAVEGTVGAREVKVTLAADWPDYVFDKDYQLKSLEEVKCFVDENKHLPDVPSSEDLTNNKGVELGNMQTLQMEKIENIYLYLFQMNERIKNLEAENAQLKEKLLNNESEK